MKLTLFDPSESPAAETTESETPASEVKPETARCEITRRYEIVKATMFFSEACGEHRFGLHVRNAQGNLERLEFGPGWESGDDEALAAILNAVLGERWRDT